jgi:cysteine desulfurase
MLPYLGKIYSNPSSVYRFAQRARKAIEDARGYVAQLLSASPEEIVFTSGGSESNNTAIKGIALQYQSKGKHIITSKTEHHSVLGPCEFLEKQGFTVSYLNVDEYGIIDLKQLRRTITKDTVLVSAMYANNETGTIGPIKDIAQICRQHQICFHTDAVQAAGKIPLNVESLGIDLLSLSAHKIYGPKGVGALYVRKGLNFMPLIHGGSHEKNRRAGTENVNAIVGLGEAARLAQQEMAAQEKRVRLLRDKLEQRLIKKIPELKVNGHPTKRLFNTLNICIRHTDGESVLINLDFKGICVSSGSACTSGSLEPSHVLLAMGIPSELAYGSLRFSLGKYSCEKEIETVLEVLPKIVKRLRKMSPLEVKA